MKNEQYWLDKLLFAQEYIKEKDKRFLELGYNISPTAGSNLGHKRTVEMNKKTPWETKEKMKAVSKKNNYKHTEEIKKELSLKKLGISKTKTHIENMSKTRKLSSTLGRSSNN